MVTLWQFPTAATPVAVPMVLCGHNTVPLQGSTASCVGSTACKTWHPAIYERWSKTRMANVVTDTKMRPEVILPGLTKVDALKARQRFS
jgi:hypothetical protein